MAERNLNRWQLNRQVNLSFFIQLIFLATLIVGSWVNIQRQLDLLQHDVSALLQCQKDFRKKLEGVQSYKTGIIIPVLTNLETPLLKQLSFQKFLLPQKISILTLCEIIFRSFCIITITETNKDH